MMNTDTSKAFDCEINPVYCQTRLEKTEREVLGRNKVVSLFDDDHAADQLKILDTRILNKLEETGGNTLLVTSPGRQEGKTLTAINLAVSFSQKVDRTVLLVDADLRLPSIHRYLGMPRQKGLSDYLLREAEISDLLINPDIAKLVFLPAGRPLPNPSEHLGSPRMKELVREMKTRYPERLIIFDSPPLLSFADTLIFSSMVDGILLVVEAEKTLAADIEKTMGLLRDKPLIGTVFNKAR